MPSKNKQQHDARPGQGGFVPASVQGSSRSSFSRDSYSNGKSHGASNSFNQYSRYATDYSDRKQGGKGKGAKVAIVLLIVALVGAMVGVGVYLYKEAQKAELNAQLHDQYSDDEMEAIDKELTGMTTFDEPFTILLLGSDARSDDPDMGARTDTIVLVRVDPTKNIISMVSIPRDTMITIEGVGRAKFNAAYTYGGPSGTIAAVKELCGVEIDHYAEVNFEGLVGLIDAIGGIDVHVDETIDDPNAGSIVIPEGNQHLDGEAALVFSRSRAYVDGDFTRVSNQRKVIEAIVKRGLEAPASDLYGLVSESVSFLTTDTAFDIDFIYSLADQIRHNNDYPVTIYSATLPSTTAMVGDESYVIADEAGIAEMMRVFLAGGDVGAVKVDITVDTSQYESTSGSTGYTDNGYGYGYDATADTSYDNGYTADGGAYYGDTGNGTDYGADTTGTDYGYTADTTGTDYGYGGDATGYGGDGTQGQDGTNAGGGGY